MSKTTAVFVSALFAVPAMILTFWLWIWVEFLAYRFGIQPGAVLVAILWNVYGRVIYKLLTGGESMTPEERKRRRERYWKDWNETKFEIAQRNASLSPVLPEWPQPRFVNDELERLIGQDLSERPLHGVPSSYTTEAACLARIDAEKAAGRVIAHRARDYAA